jgi:hypothetical protein
MEISQQPSEADVSRTAMSFAQEILQKLSCAHSSAVMRLQEFVRTVSERFLPGHAESLVCRLESVLLQIGRSPSFASAPDPTLPDDATEELRDIRESLVAAIGSPLIGAAAHFDAAFLGVASQELMAEPLTCRATAARLVEWIRSLQARGAPPGLPPSQMPTWGPRQAQSYTASFPSLCELEMPGQYAEEMEPMIDRHVRIQCVHPDLFVQPHSAGYARCLGLVGDNGKTYWFQVQGSLHLRSMAESTADDRSLQLRRFIGIALLNRDVYTRSRGIVVSQPAVAAIFPRLRLVNMPLDACSLWQVLDAWSRSEHTAAQETRLYQPLTVAAPSSLPSACALRMFPEDLLLRLLANKSISLERLFEARRHLRRAVALNSVLGLVLGVPAVMPQQIVLCPTEAFVHYDRFVPAYDASGSVAPPPTPGVPFRLTPTIARVLSEPGGMGALRAAMCATALALQSRREKLHTLLALYYRDDQPGPALPGEGQAGRFNADAAIQRLDALCRPAKQSSDRPAQLADVDQHVSDLIRAAQDETNLSSMPLSWYAGL